MKLLSGKRPNEWLLTADSSSSSLLCYLLPEGVLSWQAEQIGEITFGEGFCKCCQRQIKYIGMIYINAGEMCFIPINLRIDVFNGVRHCVQMAAHFACSLM